MLMNPWVRSMIPKLQILAYGPEAWPYDKEYKAYYAAAGADIRWASKWIAPNASVKAKEACDAKGIDIFALSWDDQPKAEILLCQERTRVKGILHHEHKVPIGDVLKAMIASNHSYETVHALLHSMEVVWILKTENSKLRPTGRDDHEAEYKKHQIEVLKTPYGLDWHTKPWRR